MKKVLTILVVLTLIAGAAFAVDTNKSITLTTEIAKIAPEFELTVKNGNEYVTADQTVASLAAVGGVTAQFKVSQIGDARLANGKVATLTVTCGEFFLYEDEVKNADVHSAVPSIADAANVAAGNRTNLDYNATAAVTDNSVAFTPKYAGFVAAGDIGTFTANWVQRTDLPAGTYKADVELAYTAL